MFDGPRSYPAKRMFRAFVGALGDGAPALTGDFQLTRVRHLRIFPRSRTMLRCVQGRAWVTFEFDSRDHFLLCGQRMTLEAGRPAFIEGIPECSLSMRIQAARAT